MEAVKNRSRLEDEQASWKLMTLDEYQRRNALKGEQAWQVQGGGGKGRPSPSKIPRRAQHQQALTTNAFDSLESEGVNQPLPAPRKSAEKAPVQSVSKPSESQVASATAWGNFRRPSTAPVSLAMTERFVEKSKKPASTPSGGYGSRAWADDDDSEMDPENDPFFQ